MQMMNLLDILFVVEVLNVKKNIQLIYTTNVGFFKKRPPLFFEC